MEAYLSGLFGCWLFCDGIFSLCLYIGRPEQKWWKDHWIRVIRALIGIMLMLFGAFNSL